MPETKQTASQVHDKLVVYRAALLVFALEAFLAAGISIAGGASMGNAFLFGRSLSRWLIFAALALAGLIFALLVVFSWRRPSILQVLDSLLALPAVRILAVMLVLLPAVALLILQPSSAALNRLLPAVLYLLLLCLQVILLGEWQRSRTSVTTQTVIHPALTLLTLALLYGAALLPSGMPARYDGLPWETPLEFLTLALFLPLAGLLNWRAFARRGLLIGSAVLLALRLVLALAAPSAGLSVNLFTSPQNMGAGQVTRTYASPYSGGASFILHQPLYHFRQFPLEWINQKSYDLNAVWLGMQVSGAGRLEDGERLVMLVSGESEGIFELTDLSSGQVLPVPVIDNLESITPDLLASAPDFRQFTLSGEIVFKGEGETHFEPLLVNNSLQVRDALSSGQLLNDANALQSLLPPAFAQPLAALADLLLLALTVAALLAAFGGLYQAGHASAFDLALAAAGLLAFALLLSQPAAQVKALLPAVCGLFALGKLLQIWLFQWDVPKGSAHLVVSLAPIFLLTFALLELDSLRSFELFPIGQDNLTYQVLARRIFVEGDLLAPSLNPHAYKFLFPYLVGTLHTLFGQSSSALFFLNTWCALLTALLISKTLSKYRLPAPSALLVPAVFIAFLLSKPFFTYYFEFGLIEPIAVLVLTACVIASIEGKQTTTLAAGLFTLLFRLDYAGAVLPAVLLSGLPLVGSWKTILNTLVRTVKNRWAVMVAQAAVLLLPSAVLLLYYRSASSAYVLNASDTRYSSLLGRLSGLLNILIGGTPAEVSVRIAQHRAAGLLLPAILVAALLVSLLLILRRKGMLARLDMRWALVYLGLLAVYFFVSPTGYAPRFSTPFLPLALVLNSLALYALLHTGTRRRQ